MTRLLRLCKIIFVVLYYGLDELVLSGFKSRRIKFLVRVITIGRKLEQPRGERLRLALTALGPIFVKFGQVLSTRRDLMPPDIADELAKLQDQVPPFDSALAVKIIEKSLGRPLGDLYENFELQPVASASIAQVHFATLRGGPNHGREVAVKVLRPGMLPVIDSDLALMGDMATWLERPTPASYAATLPTASCCACPRCTGTGVPAPCSRWSGCMASRSRGRSR